MTTLYRYFDELCGHKVRIELERFAVIKETPCGYWYIPEWMKVWSEPEQQGHKRWVSKTARVRYCYPTKDEAWKSYRVRKYRQQGHQQLARHRLDAVLALIEGLPDGHVPEGPQRLEGIITDGSLFQLDI